MSTHAAERPAPELSKGVILSVALRRGQMKLQWYDRGWNARGPFVFQLLRFPGTVPPVALSDGTHYYVVSEREEFEEWEHGSIVDCDTAVQNRPGLTLVHGPVPVVGSPVDVNCDPAVVAALTPRRGAPDQVLMFEYVRSKQQQPQRPVEHSQASRTEMKAAIRAACGLAADDEDDFDDPGDDAPQHAKLTEEERAFVRCARANWCPDAFFVDHEVPKVVLDKIRTVVRWGDVHHVYGVAANTPSSLCNLVSPVKRVREQGWDDLCISVIHQGGVSSAMPFTVEVATHMLGQRSEVVPDCCRLGLVSWIEACARELAQVLLWRRQEEAADECRFDWEPQERPVPWSEVSALRSVLVEQSLSVLIGVADDKHADAPLRLDALKAANDILVTAVSDESFAERAARSCVETAAFVLGTHSRAGQDSPIRLLDVSLLREIVAAGSHPWQEHISAYSRTAERVLRDPGDFAWPQHTESRLGKLKLSAQAVRLALEVMCLSGLAHSLPRARAVKLLTEFLHKKGEAFQAIALFNLAINGDERTKATYKHSDPFLASGIEHVLARFMEATIPRDFKLNCREWNSLSSDAQEVVRLIHECPEMWTDFLYACPIPFGPLTCYK
eukprot:m51a1_g10816 hypothetical protein (614) ;mRNA; r:42974-45672